MTKNTIGNVSALNFPKALALLAIPGIAGLLIGLQAGVQTARDVAESEEFHQMREAQRLSRESLDGFWASADAIRIQAASLSQLRQARKLVALASQMPEPNGAVLHFAQITKDPSQIVWSVRDSASSQALRSEWGAATGAREQEYLKQALAAFASVTAEQLQKDKIAMARIQRDPHRPGDFLALAFPSPDIQNGALLALVEPSEAFQQISRFGGRSEGGRARVYLVDGEGTVLAHSQGSYVGASFKDAKVFAKAIRPMFAPQSAQVSTAGRFESIDGFSVAASILRPGHLPVALVAEKTLPAEASAGWQFLRAVRMLGGGFEAWLGKIAVLGGAFVLLLGGVAFALSRASARARVQLAQASTKARQIVAEAESRAEELAADLQNWGDGATVAGPVSVTPGAGEAAFEAEMLRQELQAAQATLKKASQERSIVQTFQQEAARLRDPKSVGHRLAEAAHQLCESPTLFFSFHEGVRSAILQADAGFAPGQAPAGMSFPFDAKTFEQVVKAGQDGQPLRLTEYEPLARVMLAQLGIGHFDAWPITGYGHLGRLAGRPKLLGVLVVLQAGSDSVTRQESLSQMMRSTGLIYENALLSQ